jgi:hypothetical protein
MPFPNEAFVIRMVEKLKSRHVDDYEIVKKYVKIDNKQMDLGKLIKDGHAVKDVFFDVVKTKKGVAVSLGPWGSVSGYVDTLPVEQEGVITPGPAVIENEDGTEEVIGKTRGSLLAFGKNNVYIPRVDTDGAGKPIILTTHGDFEGVELCVVFETMKIGGVRK